MRLAFADRAQFLGDPQFNPEMPLDSLLSKSHARNLRSGIKEKRASVSDSANFNKKHLQYESEETTHIANEKLDNLDSGEVREIERVSF